MKRSVTALALMLSIAGAAWSEESDSNLRRALAAVPANSFGTDEANGAGFLDIELLSATYGSASNANAGMRTFPFIRLAAYHTFMRLGPDNWADATGVDIADIRYFAGYGKTPNAVTVWGVADDAAAKTFFDGLAAKGFSPLSGVPGVIANGAVGHADLARSNIDDPWHGAPGQTSVATLLGPRVLQATDPAAFAPILGGTALEGSPTAITLLAALEAQDGQVLQAEFRTAHFGLSGDVDLAELVARSVDDARALVRSRSDGPVEGLPAYSGIVIADLVTDVGDILTIAMAYPDCATAVAAAKHSAALWKSNDEYNLLPEATASHVDAGASGCAAVLTIKDDSDDEQSRGRLYLRTLSALTARKLEAARIEIP